PGERKSGSQLPQCLRELGAAQWTVARIRDHNDILTTQVLRLLEECAIYRGQLPRAAATLPTGPDELVGLGEERLRVSQIRVGTPSPSAETAAAVVKPPPED
ncbi:MAG: hypothetical protein AB7K36_18620, partial [Chloroflexota bacterium]